MFRHADQLAPVGSQGISITQMHSALNYNFLIYLVSGLNNRQFIPALKGRDEVAKE
jgi:hypothetical protein